MVGIADTPIKANTRKWVRFPRWSLLLVVCLLLAVLSWGMSYPIHVGTVKDLNAQAEFEGYSSVNNRGELVYAKGGRLAYKVMVQNRGNRTYSDVEVQSSLHSDGGECEDQNLRPGKSLPGSALSPVHTVSLAPGEAYEYEVIYDVPEQICSPSNHLKVRLQYPQPDRFTATSLICPAHFKFE